MDLPNVTAGRSELVSAAPCKSLSNTTNNVRNTSRHGARNVVGVIAICALVALGGAFNSVRAQQNANAAAASDLEVVQLRPNFYMIAGAGSNIGVELGDDGVVLVDTGSGKLTAEVIAAVKKLSDKPIRFIFNTSADPDHVGGNETLSKAGRSLMIAGGGGGNAAAMVSTGLGASILAYDNVLVRMNAIVDQKPIYPTGALPSDTFTSSQKNVYVNGEGIEVLHQPAAHTDGDSMIFFRRSDVIATGDVFNTETFPVIDIAKGGSIQGELDALNHAVYMAIPQLPLIWEEGGTLVIPGHGRVCDQPDLVEYRDMITIIRDVIQDRINKGDTLEQVKASDPTKEYRPRYGADSGPWTTDMFVEAVYRSLPAKDSQQISKLQPAAPIGKAPAAKKGSATSDSKSADSKKKDDHNAPAK